MDGLISGGLISGIIYSFEMDGLISGGLKSGILRYSRDLYGTEHIEVSRLREE